jgi:hypothetical protein
MNNFNFIEGVKLSDVTTHLAINQVLFAVFIMDIANLQIYQILSL